jgi:hypothetical protein
LKSGRKRRAVWTQESGTKESKRIMSIIILTLIPFSPSFGLRHRIPDFKRALAGTFLRTSMRLPDRKSHPETQLRHSKRQIHSADLAQNGP